VDHGDENTNNENIGAKVINTCNASWRKCINGAGQDSKEVR
jgi:hypothetical protein